MRISETHSSADVHLPVQDKITNTTITQEHNGQQQTKAYDNGENQKNPSEASTCQEDICSESCCTSCAYQQKLRGCNKGNAFIAKFEPTEFLNHEITVHKLPTQQVSKKTDDEDEQEETEYDSNESNDSDQNPTVPFQKLFKKALQLFDEHTNVKSSAGGSRNKASNNSNFSASTNSNKSSNSNSNDGFEQDQPEEDGEENHQHQDGDENSKNSPSSTDPTTLPVGGCRIIVVDGTKKIKYGTTYWVQRNVITVQIQAAFKFDECKIFCHKEHTSDVKHMETLSFNDHFVKLSQHPHAYEGSFKKKLPYTSGRPETQKYIWLSAEFYQGSTLLGKCQTDKFYVCSRPANDPSKHHEQVKARTKVHADNLSIPKNKSFGMQPTPTAKEAAAVTAAQMIQQKQSSMGQQNSNAPSSSNTSMTSLRFTHSPQQQQRQFVLSSYPNTVMQNTTANNTQSPPSDGSSTTSTPSSNGNGDHSSDSLNELPLLQHHPHKMVQAQSPNMTPNSQNSNSTTTTTNSPNLVNYINAEKAHLFIQSIYPPIGPAQGHQQVTLLGNFYIPASDRNETLTIYFGLLPSPRIDYVDSSKIVCWTPQRFIPGTVRVTGVLGGKMFDNFVLYTYADQAELQQNVF
jgi:hypothetical protein